MTLSDLRAEPLGGFIQVKWQTMLEVKTLGFNLYRSTSLNGPRTRLNQSLIPAKALGSPAGAAYSFVDLFTQPGVTYYYWLEEINTSGEPTLYGPLQIGGPYTLYLPLSKR